MEHSDSDSKSIDIDNPSSLLEALTKSSKSPEKTKAGSKKIKVNPKLKEPRSKKKSNKKRSSKSSESHAEEVEKPKQTKTKRRFQEYVHAWENEYKWLKKSNSESSYVLYKQNWTLEALDPIKKFETNVIKEITANHKLLAQAWSFMDSFFYSVTILTTIGYNNHTPNTPFGKVATIIYAVFGIPLMLLCICNMGIMLSELLQFGQLSKNSIYYSKSSTSDCDLCEQSKFLGPSIVKRDTIVSVNNNSNSAKRSINHTVLDQNQITYSSEENLTTYGTIRLRDSCSLCQQCSDFDINCDWCKQNMQFKVRNQDVNLRKNQTLNERESRIFWFPFTFTLSLLIMYVCIGALTYSVWKNKSFTDGAYFCFLTLTTIGSCDIYKNMFSPSHKTMELMFYCVYVLVGLILSAALVLLVQKNIKSESSIVLNSHKKSDEVAL